LEGTPETVETLNIMLESLLTKEFLSLIGGSATGFIFRTISEKRAQEDSKHNRLMNLIQKSEESHEAAAKRVPVDVGKTVRRAIVLTILFGTVIAPFILPFFEIKTVVENTEVVDSVFWGLFGSTTKTTYTPIDGFLYSEELGQVLITIVGFYFGNAAASRKT
jgi:hypothetical protein